MSAASSTLQASIKQALTVRNTSGQEGAITDQISRDIAAAVDVYVQAKLATLKVVLATPGTFVSGPPGAPVTAPGMIAYNPAA